MKIERITESTVATRDTYTHRGYKKAFEYVRTQLKQKDLKGGVDVLDLFARKCPWGDFRNDLNPDFKEAGLTNMCMDALEACQTFDNNTIDTVLFDPPFSSRMDADKYGEVGRASIWTDAKYVSELGKEMFRILEADGYIVKAGFNSNAPDPRLSLEAMFISHYGACRNDVIFSVWKKYDKSLFDYYSVD